MNIGRRLIGMRNKKLPDWETVFGGILLSTMIVTFSLLSYWFWSAIMLFQLVKITNVNHVWNLSLSN
ncbi:MAG: hypothetical protein DQL94_04985 [Lactobacillus helveticus]|nr:MAG: hypothetical protein DQL94_04985 [Lactobacillus helveticus]